MIVSISNASKVFNGKEILKNINAVIENQSRIGLIGANGVGKSTLLNIITSAINIDSGEMYINASKSIGYLEQSGGLESSRTVFEELKSAYAPLIEIQKQMTQLEALMATDEGAAKKYASLSTYFEQHDGYNTDVKTQIMINGMGFSGMENNIVSTLSGGEKTRLKMAKLLLQKPDLLILDEPTNHLDLQTVDWLEDYLSTYKSALLLVSHDRYFLDKTVNEIWEIEDRTLCSFPGNYSKFVVLKEEKNQRILKEYEAQQKQIEFLEDYIAKNIVRASTTKSAQSRRNELERMEIIEKPSFLKKKVKLNFTFDKEPFKDVLDVSGLCVCGGDNVLCQNIDFHLLKGQKVAVIGANGIGKTAFLKTILKINPIKEGKVTWGKNVKIGYYDQELSGYDDKMPVIDALWNKHKSLNDFEIRSALGGVLLSGENVFKPCGVISGGERARLAFADLMLQKANVLIFDEPTNHLDMYTKEILEEALLRFEGTVILVSHDRYLLNRVPTQIFCLEKDGAQIYLGGYDSYINKIKNQNQEKASKPTEPSKQKKQQ
ncbi:MAG: ABC-F family ATP-binding cassette domain-containing protein, partial [Ruminococcaceae bacterium]|nr:ABC-F family ATP-binding cassette domain-containing protein [Oscillospiraceae bacterium]